MEHTESLNQHQTLLDLRLERLLFVTRRSGPNKQNSRARANDSETTKSLPPRLNCIVICTTCVGTCKQHCTHMCLNPFLSAKVLPKRAPTSALLAFECRAGYLPRHLRLSKRHQNCALVRIDRIHMRRQNYRGLVLSLV